MDRLEPGLVGRSDTNRFIELDDKRARVRVILLRREFRWYRTLRPAVEHHGPLKEIVLWCELLRENEADRSARRDGVPRHAGVG
jgi:hypothetical protein